MILISSPSMIVIALILAATLVQDGCLESGLRDDLACLADVLDWLLCPHVGRTNAPWVIVRRDALDAVLDGLWDEQLRSFRTAPVEAQREHVFRHLHDLASYIPVTSWELGAGERGDGCRNSEG
jgi:hypothetical protein